MVKPLIGIFISAFAMLAIIGFINGRSAVNQTDFLENEIVKHFELLLRKAERDKGGQVHRGKVHIVYKIDGVELYRYDVETNKLVSSVDKTKIELSERFEPVARFPINENILVTLLGGGTAGFTVKGAFDRLKESGKRKSILAAILGGISGYSIGYKIGTLATPSSIYIQS